MNTSFLQINKKLLKYVGKSKYWLYIIFFMLVVSAVLGSLKPVFIGKIIDLLTISYNSKQLDENRLLHLIFLFVGTSTAAALIQYLQGYFSAHFIKEMIYNLRNDVFSKLSTLPISYFDKHSHGDIMSRLVNDTDNVAQILSQTIASFLYNLINIVTITVIMLYYSPLLTLLIYIFLPSSLFLVKWIAKKMRYYFKQKFKSYGQLEGLIEENIYAYETLLAYNKRQSVQKKFEEINEEFKINSTKAGILTSLVNPLLNVLSGLTYIVVLFVGAFMLIKGSITIGIIQAFLMYVRTLAHPLNNITSLFAQIQTAYAGAERVFELLDEERENISQHQEKIKNEINGKIEFSHVSFSYPVLEEEKKIEGNKEEEINKRNAIKSKKSKKIVSYKKVLEDLNLTIESGEKIGLVGETGSGKTSIINAFMRFYPYQSGHIKLDGKNIEEYDLTSFRKEISLVAQEPFLLTDTIKANIAYPFGASIDKKSQDLIEKAAKNANVDDFINTLPEKYDTVLSNEGKNLSLGQKQLLCLARTFMQNAPILIMDEATANVDTLTEMQIQEAIFKLMKEKTCIVIAHRLSTIIKMDRIVVLEKGKIVEIGKHEELLAKKSHYYKLYTHQLQYID